jgi:hypothetical protein
MRAYRELSRAAGMKWRRAGSFGCTVVAAVMVMAGTAAADGTQHGMSDPVTIEGVLSDEGVTCPALRGDDGELYTIAGDIGELQPGQRVRVTGEVAEMSICMQGTTIALGDITPLAE